MDKEYRLMWYKPEFYEAWQKKWDVMNK